MTKGLMKAAAITSFMLPACAATIAHAQDSVASFYKGKTVNLVIGAELGGGGDGYPGTPELFLALQRGEVGMTASGELSRVEELLATNRFKILYQTGILVGG